MEIQSIPKTVDFFEPKMFSRNDKPGRIEESYELMQGLYDLINTLNNQFDKARPRD